MLPVVNICLASDSQLLLFSFLVVSGLIAPTEPQNFVHSKSFRINTYTIFRNYSF
jgi:hypothetical protein